MQLEQSKQGEKRRRKGREVIDQVVQGFVGCARPGGLWAEEEAGPDSGAHRRPPVVASGRTDCES